MAAVRCKECAFVAKKNDGFCPECGAMYVEPLELVDESLAGKAPARTAPKAEKKKGGGLLSSLFGSKDSKEESAGKSMASQAAPQRSGQLPEGVPRDQIKIRCQECKHLSGVDQHSGYCDNCGAFYVEPHDYVTTESLAAERQAEHASLDQYKPVHKTFDQMDEAEKLHHLKENVADIWDRIVKDRYTLNEKANECMQCFTAAGTIKSEDQYEVLASMIKQRHHNLKDFEIFYREYKQLLEQFETLHEELLAARREYIQQEKQTQQVQASS